jgi:hypothetical protein
LDQDLAAEVFAGQWLSSGTLDPDLTAVNGCKRQGRRNAAAGSPARPQSRVFDHGLKRGRHLCEAREQAKQSRVAVSAETQRSGRSTWNTNSGEVPRATGCTGMTTSDAGGFLTSLRVPGCAP